MDNIKSFINYGINNRLNVKNIKRISASMNIFYFIGFLYGILLNGVHLYIGALLFAIGIFSTLYILMTHTKDTMKNYFRSMGLISFSGMINFSLFSVMLCRMLNVNIFISITVMVVPVASVAALTCIILQGVKKGKYQNARLIKKATCV